MKFKELSKLVELTEKTKKIFEDNVKQDTIINFGDIELLETEKSHMLKIKIELDNKILREGVTSEISIEGIYQNEYFSIKEWEIQWLKSAINFLKKFNLYKGDI